MTLGSPSGLPARPAAPSQPHIPGRPDINQAARGWWLALLLFVLCGLNAQAQSTPVLIVTPSSVSLRQIVTAQASALDPNLTYTLDWGDNEFNSLTGSATAQSLHNYRQAGTYTVRLSASDLLPASATVTVTQPVPTLSAAASGLNVTLNLGNLLVDYPYEIRWGDDVAESTSPNANAVQVTHLFHQPGTYVIQVTPQNGTPVTTTVTLAYPTPILVLTPGGGTVGQPVTADVSGLVPTLITTLNWGDGTSDTLTGAATAQKAHTYTRPGTYVVTLTSSGTTPVTFTVTLTVPVPTVSVAATGLSATLNLSNLLSGYVYSVAWGDGTTNPLTPTADTAQLNHTYAQPGTVTIQVTPQGGTPVTATATLTAPTPVLSVTPSAASVRQTVTATLASLVTILTYTLDWGDTTTDTATGSATGQKTHTYIRPGTYVVTLTSPGTTPVTATVSATIPAPVAAVTSSALNATLNLSNLLSGYAYSVAWGDGITEPLTPNADTAQLNHTYAQPGSFTLQITPQDGTPVTSAVTLTAPNSVLTVTPSSTNVRQTVTANLMALVPTLAYTLNWGDGATDAIIGAASIQKTHAYARPGTYTVGLTATGTAPVTVSVSVGVPAPVVTATSSALSATLNLSNLLSGYVYSVAWGDGTTEPLTATTDTAQLTHAYARPGPFTVQVTPQGGAPVTVAVTFTLPTATLTVTAQRLDAAAELGQLVSGQPYTLNWGDTVTETFTPTGPTTRLTHTYAQPGAVTVTLSAAGLAPVSAALRLSAPPALEVGAEGLSANASISQLTVGLAYTLDWGDGATEPLTASAAQVSRTHAYARPGTYIVRVSLPGGDGASGTVTLTAPAASLTLTPTAAAPGQPVTVSLSGLAPSLTYTLAWGDGKTETLTGLSTAARTHAYADASTYITGTFRVTLSAPGVTPVTAVVTVSVPVPTLAFTQDQLTVTATVGNLIPLTSPAFSYLIDWGDGSVEPFVSSGSDLPLQLTHRYARAGTFQVRVTPPAAGIPVQSFVTVTFDVPVPTLSLAPDRLQVTLTVGNLLRTPAEALAYRVDWGDGSTETFANAAGTPAAQLIHTYARPGTYRVQVTPPAGGAPVSASVTLSVPDPVLTVTPTSAAVREPVTANVSGLTSTLSYVLSWGDDTTETLTGQSAFQRTHTYARAGNFRLQVESVFAFVTVTVPVPTVTATANTLTAVLTLGNLLPGYGYTISWEYGVEETLTPTATTAQLSHTYARPGRVTPIVTPLGGNGVVTTVTLSASAPVLNVTPAVLTIGEPVTASLSNLLPVTYTLEWGDGAYGFVPRGSTASLTHTYTTLGTFRVTLTAQDAAPVTATVSVNAPTPTLSVSPATPAVRQPVTANAANLRGELTYTLDWGDNTTDTLVGSTQAAKTHSYGAPGTFAVTLTSPGTAVVTTSVTASIPAPTTTVTDGLLSVILNLENLLSGSVYSVEWGDGATESLNATAATAQLSHTYARPGSYALKVSIAGVNPVMLSAVVRAPSPVLVISLPEVDNRVPALVGQNVGVTLTALVPALSYTLDWGDGAAEVITGVTTTARTHVYLKEGTYGIRTEQAQGYTARDYLVVVTLPAPVFTASAVRLDATATLTALIPVVNYTFDWGDGTPVVIVNGVAASTLTHHYAALGDYALVLTASGRLTVRQGLTIGVDGGALSVSIQGVQASAQLSGMQPELSYTLNWGDGSTELLTGAATATRTHTYALPGSYTVTLAAPRVPGASATVTAVAQAPVLGVSASGLTGAAQLSGLLPGVNYLLEWGDGAGVYLKDQATVTLTHVYSAPGAYTVRVAQAPYGIRLPGIPEASAALTVGLPPSEAVQVLGTDDLGAGFHFRVTGLLQGGTYLLDFGDNTTPERLTGGADVTVNHTYPRSGTYPVILRLQTFPGDAVRATAVSQVQITLGIQFAALTFTQPYRDTDLALTSLGPIEAALSVSYRGGGRLTGRWVLDGQPVQDADVTLPEASGVGTAEVKFTRTENRPGRHTLNFEFTGTTPVSVRPVTYALNTPSVLNYGDFKVTVGTVTEFTTLPGGGVTLSGTGTVKLVVGGTPLNDVNVKFSGQQVNSGRVLDGPVVTAELNGQSVRNVRLGDLSLRADRLTLNKDGGKLNGNVTLPVPGAASVTLSFTDVPLAADSGDLTATLRPNSPVQDLKLPEDGLSLSATAAVLDLSAAQNIPELAAAYREQASPQNDWMGLVFPAASLSVGTPILGQSVTVTLPVAYNLSGYVTTIDLPAAKTDLMGWAVDVSSLHASVLAGRISTTTGAGSVTLPLTGDRMDLKLGWNTNARPGARLTLSAGTAVKPHSFGRTSLTLGDGVWTLDPAGATVTFSNARWFLDNQGNDVGMNNLTMSGNGDVSLGGQAWSSVTGKTALTVLGYPLAASQVGVQRQSGGVYSLGLKGRLQVNEKLPVNTTDTPTLFWVQGGKDLKITTDAIHLAGELIKVPYDINLTGALTDQGNLEFAGTGKMTVAGLLNVDARARFGRFAGTSYEYFKPNTSGSVGYGSVTASLYANPDLGKPLVSVKRVELYELYGGLTVNMEWPGGRLDEEPVFRQAGPNMVFQVGALLSVKQDKDPPFRPYLKGDLSVDTSGVFNMKADAWLVRKGQKLVQGTPNGRALVSVSGERLLVQACVGPSGSVGSGSVGGLNCAGLADLNLYDLMTLRGSMELYAPYSGSDQHLYIGTKASPVVIKVPNYPEGNGYLMVDQNSVRAGAGVTWGFERGDSGSLLVCSWHWNIKATATLNADFGVTYSPASLDGAVNFSANAAASAGGCGVNVGVSANMTFDGKLHLASDSNYFDGSVSASVRMPVIPDISFKVNAKVKF